MLLEIFIGLFCTYLFYTRIVKVYSAIIFYKLQGVPFHWDALPLVGCIPSIWYYGNYDNKIGQHPVARFLYRLYNDNPPSITGLLFSSKVLLFVNKPDVITDLFITKNKFFDKHHNSGHHLKQVLGDSILFARSNEMWQHKRKSLSQSLYKEKLIAMTKVMKEVTLNYMKEWQKLDELDICKRCTDLLMEIILSCACAIEEVPFVD